MEYYFITGASRGIGKALAENILQREDTVVYGLSRTHSIRHERYHPVQLDLSVLQDVRNFDFPSCEMAERIILVNNAGMIGVVSYAGQLDAIQTETLYNVNLIAPVVLTNTFLHTFSVSGVPLVIMNISSGAGKNPIDGWSNYCASKAALDMFSRTVHEELLIAGKKHIRIFSIAPGIVDTAMQDEIRKADSSQFSRLEQFRSYKEEGQLSDPLLTSGKLLSILDKPDKYTEVVFSVKDIQS